MNLKFKSSEPDLKFNIQSQLRIINQNILYLTRQVDLCVKWLKTEEVNNNLQRQVDDYMDNDLQNQIPAEDKQEIE